MEEVKNVETVEEVKTEELETPTEDVELENNDELEGLDTEVEEEPEEPKKESKKKEKEPLTWKVSNAQFNNYTEEAIAKPIKKYLDDLADIDQFFLCHEVDLVEDDRVAELDLLDQQVLDILVVDVVLQQVAAAAELGAQARRVYDGYDVVEVAELGQTGIVI